jgi:hypothetical protein
MNSNLLNVLSVYLCKYNCFCYISEKLNRTVCYSCPDVVHPSKCDNLDVCDIDKVR